MNDQRMDQIIGNLLRAGVILAAVIVVAGGGFYLSRHGQEVANYHVFRGEPKAWGTLAGLFSPATFGSGRAIIMAGILVLILTPVARVAFSLWAFAMERDWSYVAITTTVLALLIYGLTSA